VQTIAIDNAAGMVNLTNDAWPRLRRMDRLAGLPIAEMASPSAGRALTYARSTLVGIAGEDDLDAPAKSSQVVAAPRQDPRLLAWSGRLRQPAHLSFRLVELDTATLAPPPRGDGRDLPPDQSAAVRDRLLSEMAEVQSGDTAATGHERPSQARGRRV
jgi:hypothetical protein